MCDSIDNEKAELRKRILKEIKAYDKKASSSARACTLLRSHPRFKDSSVILAFAPLKTEVDISPILSDERILLPYIENGEMRFSRCNALIKSSMGFLEPEIKREVIYDNALMLVPLIAYDKHNNRLGRGGGFYDRYISKHREKLYTIGIAYPVSYVDSVPTANTDECLDEILHIE